MLAKQVLFFLYQHKYYGPARWALYGKIPCILCLLLCRSYIANRVTDKIAEVSKHIYCCRSGSAADTQAITGFVKYELEMLEWVMLFAVVFGVPFVVGA